MPAGVISTEDPLPRDVRNELRRAERAGRGVDAAAARAMLIEYTIAVAGQRAAVKLAAKRAATWLAPHGREAVLKTMNAVVNFSDATAAPKLEAAVAHLRNRGLPVAATECRRILDDLRAGREAAAAIVHAVSLGVCL